MDNVWLISLAFWPAVVVLCAGLNMLITWTFSWSELVFAYLAGIVAGYLLFAGTEVDPNGAKIFFFAFSHGAPALLWSFSEGFRDAFGDVATFFWFMAGLRLGCTVWSAAWDHLSSHLGPTVGVGPILFSLVPAIAKLPWALVTSGIGFLIWIGGLFSIIWGGRASFAGGVFWSEFKPSASGHHATTLGFTTHAWYGSMPLKHELYHTRQYIYLGDWMIPFWLLGCLWGLGSGAISPSHSANARMATAADGQVGNPLEVAAYYL